MSPSKAKLAAAGCCKNQRSITDFYMSIKTGGVLKNLNNNKVDLEMTTKSKGIIKAKPPVRKCRKSWKNATIDPDLSIVISDEDEVTPAKSTETITCTPEFIPVNFIDDVVPSPTRNTRACELETVRVRDRDAEQSMDFLPGQDYTVSDSMVRHEIEEFIGSQEYKNTDLGLETLSKSNRRANMQLNRPSGDEIVVEKMKPLILQEDAEHLFYLDYDDNAEISNRLVKEIRNDSMTDPDKTIEYDCDAYLSQQNDDLQLLELLKNEMIECIARNRCQPKLKSLYFIIADVISSTKNMQLLRADELQLLLAYLKMSVTYQIFCHKLFLRQPIWYGMYDLTAKLELELTQAETIAMYMQLRDYNCIETDYSKQSLGTLLHQMDLGSLKALKRNLKLKSARSTRGNIIAAILAFCTTQMTLTTKQTSKEVVMKEIENVWGPRCKLSRLLFTLFNRVHLLLSFVNPELSKLTDLYHYVLRLDSGEIVLPAYRIEQNCSVFDSKRDFLEYSIAAEFRHQFDQSLEKKQWELVHDICDKSRDALQAILSDSNFKPKNDHRRRFTAGQKYCWILSEGSKHLTKEFTGDVQAWLELLCSQNAFCLKYKGLWYDRLALIQKNYNKDLNESAKIVIQALQDEDVTIVGRVELMKRAGALHKSKRLSAHLKLKLSEIIVRTTNEFPTRTVIAKTVPGTQSGQRCYYMEKSGNTTTYYTVEEFAIKDYIENENFTNGIHCEGSLLATLLAVLLWDLIYDYCIPMTFINPIQEVPLDYYGKEFYLNRKNVIDKRLLDIKETWCSDYLEQFIVRNYESNCDTRSPIVTSLVQKPDDLVTIVRCIGRERLVKVFERILSHSEMHAGMPDLFVWDCKSLKCKFVEVKSENDKLSTKQILWLNFLQSVDLSVELFQVKSSANKLSRKPKSKMVDIVE